MFEWFRILISIIVIDLVLSGDNALLIGAVMSRLLPHHRWIALLTGGGGAIILRIALSIGITLLLQVPLIKALGGIVILLVAVKLLLERNKAGNSRPADGVSGLLTALATILVADLTSSVDNIIVVGALANGNLLLLGIGLFVSIVCVLVASAIIAKVMTRLTWLLDVASVVLGWTSAQMLLEDVQVRHVLVSTPMPHMWVPLCTVGVILSCCVWSRLRVAVA